MIVQIILFFKYNKRLSFRVLLNKVNAEQDNLVISY